MALKDKIPKILTPRVLLIKTCILSILIIVDIIAVVYLMIFDAPPELELRIIIFDLFICMILLIEFSINFYISKPKKIFLKNNWLDLIASIPFDLILPTFFSSVRFIRLFRILKILRVSALFGKYFKTVNEFIKVSNLDKILSGLVVTIFSFTLIMFFFGPSYGLFDDLYFVVVTLATVGYGDVVPQTFTEKIIALILIFIGIFVFSTITASISFYFTNKLISKEDEELENEIKNINNELKSVNNNLKDIEKENNKLHEEIKELKEIIKNKD